MLLCYENQLIFYWKTNKKTPVILNNSHIEEEKYKAWSQWTWITVLKCCKTYILYEDDSQNYYHDKIWLPHGRPSVNVGWIWLCDLSIKIVMGSPWDLLLLESLLGGPILLVKLWSTSLFLLLNFFPAIE